MASSIDTKPADVEPALGDAGTESDRFIIITDKAMSQLRSLIDKIGQKKVLRMGVRAGGCSGMSYIMDFVDESTQAVDDQVEQYDDIKCIIDSKSLMFIYGLKLDYSDELIGGGFQFSNPNAETNCGCGKSFGV